MKTLADFSDKDRIAVPGIKTSLPAVVLQMAAAKAFGDKQYNKLDPITVPLPHPMPPPYCSPAAARSTATWHRRRSRTPRPPRPGCTASSHTVDVLGNITLDMTYTSKKFYEANPRCPPPSSRRWMRRTH